MPPQVFISYASSDDAQACEVLDALQGRGIHCWRAPEALRAGDRWAHEIENRIRQCSVFVLLWSGAAEKSAHVDREIHLAATARLLVIPVRLDHTDLSGRFFLSNLQARELADDGLQGLADLVQSHLRMANVPYPLRRLYYDLPRDRADVVGVHLEAVRLLVRYVAFLHVARYVESGDRDESINRMIEESLDATSLFTDFELAKRLAEFFDDRGEPLHASFRDFFKLPPHRVPTARDFEESDDAADAFDLKHLYTLCSQRSDVTGASATEVTIRQSALCTSVQDFLREALTQDWALACKLFRRLEYANREQPHLLVDENIEYAHLPPADRARVRLSTNLTGRPFDVSPFFTLVPTATADGWQVGILRRQRATALYWPLALGAADGCEGPPVDLPWGRLEVTRRLPDIVFLDEEHTATLHLSNESAGAIEIEELVEELPENLLTAGGSRKALVAGHVHLEQGEKRDFEYAVRGTGLPGTTRAFSTTRTVAYSFGGELQHASIGGHREVLVQTIPPAGLTIRRQVLDAEGFPLDEDPLVDGEYVIETSVTSRGRALPEIRIEDEITGAIALDNTVLWDRGAIKRVDSQPPIRGTYRIRIQDPNGLRVRAHVSPRPQACTIDDTPLHLDVGARPPPRLELHWRAVTRTGPRRLQASAVIGNIGGTAAYSVRLASTPTQGVQVEMGPTGGLDRIAADAQVIVPVYIDVRHSRSGPIPFELTYRTVAGVTVELPASMALDRLLEPDVASLPAIGRQAARAALRAALADSAASLIGVHGEHGVGKAHLVRSEVALMQRDGRRVGFYSVECDPARGLAAAIAELIERLLLDWRPHGDPGARGDIVAFLDSIGMDESEHRGPVNMLVDLLQNGQPSQGVYRAVAGVLVRFARTRELDRLVLLMRGLSEFSRQELRIFNALRAEIQNVPAVRLVLTADRALSSLGVDASDVEVGRFTDGECREVIDRVFIMPTASERLRQALISRSEGIPANLFSLLRRLVDDQDELLDFDGLVGVDTRDGITLDDLPTTFQDAEARAAELSEIDPVLLAAFAAIEGPIREQVLSEVLHHVEHPASTDSVQRAVQIALDRSWLRSEGAHAYLPTSNTVRRALGQAAGRPLMQRVHETLFQLGRAPVDHLVECRSEFLVQHAELLTAGLRQVLGKGRFGQLRRLLRRVDNEVGAALPAACQVEIAVLEQELQWEETGDLDPTALEALAPRIRCVPGRERRAELRARMALIASRWYRHQPGGHLQAVAVAEAAFSGLWGFRRLRISDPQLEFEFQLHLWTLYYRGRNESKFRRVDDWLWKRVTEKHEGVHDCQAIARFLGTFLELHREMPDPEKRRAYFSVGSVEVLGAGRRPLRDSEIEVLTRTTRLQNSELQQFLEHPEQLNLENALLFGRVCVEIGALLALEFATPEQEEEREERQERVNHYLKLALALFKESGFPYDYAVTCRTMADWCSHLIESEEPRGEDERLGQRFEDTDRLLGAAASKFATLHAETEHLDATLARAANLEQWIRHDPATEKRLIAAYEALIALPAFAAYPEQREQKQLALLGLYERVGRVADAARVLEGMGEASPLVARHRAVIHAESLLNGSIAITDDTLSAFEADMDVLAGAAPRGQPGATAAVDAGAVRALAIIAWELIVFYRARERGALALARLRSRARDLQASPDLLVRVRREVCSVVFDLWRMAGPSDEEMIRDFSSFLLPVLQPEDRPQVERMLEDLWAWEAARDGAPRRLAAPDMMLALCETDFDRGDRPERASALGREVLSRILREKTREGAVVARLLGRGIAVALRSRVPGDGAESFLDEVSELSRDLEQSGHPETALQMLIHLIELTLEMHRRTHNQWYYEDIIKHLAPRLLPLRKQRELNLETTIHLINLFLQLPDGLTDAVELMEEHCRRLLAARDYAVLPRYLSFLSDLLLRLTEESQRHISLFVLSHQATKGVTEENVDADAPQIPAILQRDADIRAVATQLCLDIIRDLSRHTAGRPVQRSVLYDAAKLLTKPGTADLSAAIYAKLFDLSEGISGSCVWSTYAAWVAGSTGKTELPLHDQIALTSFSSIDEESEDGQVQGSPRNYLINTKLRNELLKQLAGAKTDDERLSHAHAVLEVRRLTFLAHCARNVHEFPEHADDFERMAWVTFLQGYLFEESSGAPLWQQLQRISAHASVIDLQARRAFEDLARVTMREVPESTTSLDLSDLIGGGDPGEGRVRRALEASDAIAREVLATFRRRGQQIMTHLAARVRHIGLMEILGEVQRRLEGKGRSIDFGEILGLWGTKTEEDAGTEATRERATAFLDRDPRELITPLINSGLQLLSVGHADAAERMYRFALTLCDRATEPHPHLPLVLRGLAGSLAAQGNHAGEREVLLQEVAVCEARGDRELSAALGRLADSYEALGEAEAGLPHLRRKLILDEAQLGADNVVFALAQNQAALKFRDAGHLQEAEALWRRALAIDQAGQPPGSPVVPHRLYNLSTALLLQGKLDETRATLAEAIRLKGEARDVTMARVLLLQVGLHLAGDLPDEGRLAKLKALIGSGEPLPVPGNLVARSDFTQVLRYLKLRLAPDDGAFLEALAAAVNDPSCVARLGDFERWRAATCDVAAASGEHIGESLG